MAITFLVFCLLSCTSKPTLFKQVSSSHSGIQFTNTITENDSINPIDIVNIYNGGGVGIGDFNNDGLQDIYFTGNMVANKLYLNKGDFKFDDITKEANADGMGRWARGVAVVDINNDGLQDIYICNTVNKDSLKRRNILYVNQGIDKDGIPHFKDMAAEYGLDVHMQSTMANFFDYDNDGDLDVYITDNEASSENNPSAFGKSAEKKITPSVGRLYRNDINVTLKHGVFTDVSEQAGITLHGFGHAATIADINLDGWKDIYVSDDFISNNILYINNHDGTFTDHARDYFKHTSFNAMGQDIQDINNDGLADVFELDMSPPDNYRKKMMLNSGNYNTFQNFNAYGYQYQYVRNTLQLNGGPRLLEGDSLGAPAFSEVSFMSGVAQTDWSWTPLITDFNNDSYRDIIVTNGFPKDVSDHDFIAYRQESTNLISKEDLLKKIPEIKLHNYAFQNNDGLHFKDVSADWGLSMPTFSNGAAYADLDNDGDLDMVINNINDEALVYQNTTREKNDGTSHYLHIAFEGDGGNRNGIGAFASIYYDGGKQQVYENTPYRGYLSTVQSGAHFGLGKTSMIDSVVIKWADNKMQVIKNVKADQLLKVNVHNAGTKQSDTSKLLSVTALFKEVTTSLGIDYKHRDFDFIDFNIQTTLPHKLSEYCPALAAGDVNGDGLDDLVMGGNRRYPAQVFLQQRNGKFLQRDLTQEKDSVYIDYKDGGILLIDVNGDGKLDVYATSTGYQNAPNSNSYGDRLYINSGGGNFTLAKDALPVNYTSKLCVRAMDYNKDGKPDLFVSGRVMPWAYPKPVSSFIYRNDSKDGKARFTDVTAEVAPALKNIGMVCDALFTDFDGDGQTDLLLAGEWMPITFLKNVDGKFKNVTSTGIGNQSGWWNSIAAGDFRHTGRTDYIVGNAGANTLYKASQQYPVFITAKDFGGTGSYQPIPSLFLPAPDGSLKEYPANGRDELIDKMPFLKKRFPDFKSFATATINDLLTDDMRKGAQRLEANNLQSCFVRNDGGGKFTLMPLPAMAQVSVLNGMLVDDFDGDGNLDVMINGNDYGTEVTIGRYDALNGLLLRGNGKGDFMPQSILQSGIYLPGNGKGLIKLLGASGNYLVAGSQNLEALKLFELRSKTTAIRVLPDDSYAIIKMKNGTVRKEEFYYGQSFLSQSSRFIKKDDNVASIEMVNAKGEHRIAGDTVATSMK